MRKLLTLLLMLMMTLSPVQAEDEGYSIYDLLADADPDVVADTFDFDTADGGLAFENGTVQVIRPTYEEDGSILITITATGDFTVGGDSRKSSSLWDTELKKHNGDPNFALAEVKEIFTDDDLTLINFEGTLTESTYVPPEKRENEFLFSAPPDHVKMLTSNSIEAVSLENNHVLDHGQAVWDETKTHLTDAGVIWSGDGQVGVYEVKGLQIAMLSYLCIDRYDKLWDKVPQDIQEAKALYDIVIVSFHWGNEKMYSPTNNQVKMGRLAADSGADLVIGHHSHRIQPIEYYNGVYICYSLGNFCFAGHNKPSDMLSFLFQTRFRMRDGVITNEGFRIIPISISSKSNRNDFIPTPLEDSAERDTVLKVLRSHGEDLTYAVPSYPLEWSE